MINNIKPIHRKNVINVVISAFIFCFYIKNSFSLFQDCDNNILIDPSFEIAGGRCNQSTRESSSFCEYGPDDYPGPAWRVDAGTVDIKISPRYPSIDGNYSIDLSGDDNGVFCQDFSISSSSNTIKMSWYIAANPDRGPYPKSYGVQITPFNEPDNIVYYTNRTDAYATDNTAPDNGYRYDESDIGNLVEGTYTLCFISYAYEPYNIPDIWGPLLDSVCLSVETSTILVSDTSFGNINTSYIISGSVAVVGFSLCFLLVFLVIGRRHKNYKKKGIYINLKK